MENTKKIAMKVSVITITINTFLAVFKFIAGILSNSGAMLSDAVHSSSDVFSTFIVMIGVHASAKQSDSKHRYGHERFECVASMILAMILLVTGFEIGKNGAEIIISGNYKTMELPGMLALIAAIISTIIKEWMYWYTRGAAKKIKSGALMADAWHHRSDALSSIGAFVGILGARLGFPILEPIASLIICIFIAKAAIDIFIDSVNKIVDKSCDTKIEEAIIRTAKEAEGVIEVDELRTRLFGSRVYVDIEISADGSITLFDGHLIAERVHDLIEKDFPDVKHCMVHVNPHQEKHS